MKSIVVTRAGGPEVLELKNEREPDAANSEVVVAVRAAGLNFADLAAAAGKYPGVPPVPFIAGREFAGVVEGTGEEVMGYTQWGAFAEKIAIPRSLLWPKPKAFSFAEAAAFPVNYFTAYLAYWKAGMVSSPAGGDHGGPDGAKDRPRVLIHAVAGGVGTAAVEIGKALGVETFGTSSSDEKLSRARELGLEHAINYTREDYETRIRELTNGEGVDAVFEMLGGEHTAKSERCLRFFGRVISYGTATGKAGQVDPRTLYARCTSVHGLWLSRLAQREELMRPAWQALSAWIEAGKLRPLVGAVLPLGDAAEGYRMLMERRNVGKVILQV